MKTSKIISAAVVVSALLVFSGCTIKSNEGKNGQDKVDIKTPFGSLKVDENVDPRDTGLPLYAGAKPYEKKDGHDAANVDISSSVFGVKVVAAEFTTPDSPDKVRDFYQKAMKNFGTVVVCTGSYPENINASKGGDDKDKDKPVSCSDTHGSNGDIELKVGTERHQHVVGLKPDGSGTRFALVYVNTRGAESGS